MSLFHSNDSSQDNSQVPLQNELASQPDVICTGLSGNELYCIALSGFRPGNLLVGNSVYSLGFIGGITSNIHSTIGGEISQYTNMCSEGRRLSLERFDQELQQSSAVGATGVTSEIIFHPGNIEFLSVGSSLYMNGDRQMQGYMTSSADGQELFCQMDAGFEPIRLAFGNVAYSIGIGRTMMGNFRQLAHGEVTQYSNIFSVTRNTALKRICEDAKKYNANSVIGIRTTILPIGASTNIQEMIMIGTASYNPKLEEISQQCGGVITSDLTSEEMWNVMRMGYVPVQLVLGTSVYSLGVMGGLKAALRGIAKGEINSLTQQVYGAREQSLKKVQEQCKAIGGEMVVGIKTYIYQLDDGLIEFLAIGTAIRRVEGSLTRSDQLPPQAIIRDKDTFVNTVDNALGTEITHAASGINTQSVDAKV